MEYCKEIPKNIKDLGELLQHMFGDRLFNNIKMNTGHKVRFESGKPHLILVKKNHSFYVVLLNYFYLENKDPLQIKYYFVINQQQLNKLNVF